MTTLVFLQVSSNRCEVWRLHCGRHGRCRAREWRAPLDVKAIHIDPRMLSTIGAILENPRHGGLVSDSLVYRYPPQPRIDGLPGEEGTFNMCSFWLVEALTRAGLAFPEKLDQARLLFERWKKASGMIRSDASRSSLP